MTEERKKAAEEFLAQVGRGDPSAQSDFLLTMYDVAMASSHTTSEFGLFMAGVWVGFLNVQTLMRQGYPMALEDTARSKAMSDEKAIVDEVTKSWYRSFKKWREDELKTEGELSKEFETFKRDLAALMKVVDRENN